MADKSYTWQVSSPYIDNGPGVISSAYNVNNKSPFTTITTDNPLGYVKVFPNSNSTDLNIKNLEYAVRADGVITYRVQDGTNNPRQYNSLQQLADGRGGWNASTTEQVKIQMNSILTDIAKQKNIKATGTGTETSSDAVEDTEPNFSLENVDLNLTINSIDSAIKKHGDYKYPFEISDNMDRITFRMIQYQGRSLSNNRAGFDPRFNDTDKIKTSLGSVTMGIQPRISDRNSVSWNDLDANTLALLAAGSSLDIANLGASGIETVLNKIGNTLGAEKSNIEKAIKLSLAGQAASISGLTSRIGGAIFNPNLELLFDNPQLRPFDFTFQLSPRDRDEAREVKKIIRFFKQGMAVQRTAAELFLKAPNVFDITYIYKTSNKKTGVSKSELHSGLNLIKTCALMSCSVDYTPSGSYMTFPDGTMTSYNITLSFKELEPVYSDNYQDPQKDNDQEILIGF